jgi:drug/metabolite transporter (DMT)-like permease
VISTVALLPAVLVSPPAALPTSAALGSIAVLGVACTALGLVAFFQLIAEAGPNRASVVTYVNPPVAVVAGVVALGEHLGVMSLAGLLLILGGSWLSTATARQVA